MLNRSQIGAAIQIVKRGSLDLGKANGVIQRLNKSYWFTFSNTDIQQQFMAFIGSSYCLSDQGSYKTMYSYRKRFLSQFAI